MFKGKQEARFNAMEQSIASLSDELLATKAVLRTVMNQSQRVFDTYSEILSVVDMGAVDRRYAEMTQAIICRVSAVETMLGRQNGDIHRHEQTFKALGADMIARASGDGSVAPPVPATKKGK